MDTSKCPRHVTTIIGLTGPLCTAATVLVQSVALTRTHLLRAGNDTVSNVDFNVAWWWYALYRVPFSFRIFRQVTQAHCKTSVY